MFLSHLKRFGIVFRTDELIFMYTRIDQVCAPVRARMRASVCACVCACVRACVHVCACIHACVRACMHVCACVHACVRAHVQDGNGLLDADELLAYMYKD